ncbi:LCP family protein [Hamadaea sp. NPDC050747]|uniref:LCP family protein n=1 Tax=Hamadaea sp. NPDC050747 TaxID=3155789 RepID=UPI0033E343C1
MADGSVYTSRSRTRRRVRRFVIAGGLAVVVLAGAAGAGGWLYLRNVDKKVDRISVAALSDAKQSTPEGIAEGAMNILLLGSDSRDPDQTSGSRTDTIMVAHISADHKNVQLVSIPRDTWVYVPESTDGEGGEFAKINSAYAWGGADLMVQTVEKFTGLQLDHVMMIDFAGFKEIIDAVGGIDIKVDKTFTSIHAPYRKFTKNAAGTTTHMDGATALDYARQRKQFPDGDFARIAHQHQIIKAVMDKATSTGTVTDLGKLTAFLNATASAVTVDDTLSPLNLAWALRTIGSSDVTFVTNPTGSTPTIDGQSVVKSDTVKATELWESVESDTVPTWALANPSYVR